MKAISCIQVQEKLWRYADRELPAPEQVALSAHLAECDACRAAYHGRVAESRLLRESLLAPSIQEDAFGDAFTARCMESARRIAPMPGALAGAGRARRTFWARRPVWIGLAAAAVVLAPILAVLIVGGLQPAPVGWFEVRGEPVGTGRLDSTGRVILENTPVAVEGPYFASRVFRVPASSRLLLEPVGSVERSVEKGERAPWAVCRIGGPAFVIVDPETTRGRFVLRLTAGLLDATVAKLEPGEEFVVRTPHAVARVVGTDFRVEVAEGTTSLWVREGTVAFAGLDARRDDETLQVASGDAWAIDARGRPERVASDRAPGLEPEVEPVPSEATSVLPPSGGDARTDPSSRPTDPPTGEPGEVGPLLNGREADLDTPVNPAGSPPDADQRGL